MKERVIVLRAFKYSESDLIIHSLTPKGARLNFIARGALKSRKRFGGGVLEPTHYILASYRPSRNKGDEDPLHHLLEAELIKGFPGLRDEFDRLNCALAIVGLVEKLAQPEVVDSSEVFDLLGNALFAAESSQHLKLLRLQFDTKFLYLQGVLMNDPQMAELLRRPLKEHGQISLAEAQISRLQFEVKRQLDHYLRGMTPFGHQDKEV